MELGDPKALFMHPLLPATYTAYQYDVSPDGDKFVFLSASIGKVSPPVRVIINWESLLNR